jgi:hypothetical protein
MSGTDEADCLVKGNHSYVGIIQSTLYSVPAIKYFIFIYLLIVFQNPYTGVRPMDIGTKNK